MVRWWMGLVAVVMVGQLAFAQSPAIPDPLTGTDTTATPAETAPAEMAPAVSPTTTAKNLYLVTMDSVAITPTTPPQQVAPVVENMIVPGFERLLALERDGKILAGGGIVGSKGLAFIIEASSNAEASRLIMSTPLWGMGTFKITPLERFDDRIASETANLNQLKALTPPAPVAPATRPIPRQK